MTDVTSEPPRELSHQISYQTFAGGAHNLDFKGSGTLAIRPDGPTYVFRGKRRKMFAGAPVDQEYGPDDIWNVVVADKRISFRTNRGEAGGKKQLFVFYCQNAAEAAAVAALLPTRLDEEFTAARDFHAKLNAIGGPRKPWSSVTNVIIALNCAVFIIMGCLGAGWFEVDSMTPYIQFGANNGAATTDGEWWRLLTSMFVHYGILHLALNMWALYQIGHFLEKLLGRRLYALTYLATGLAGGFTSILWHKDQTWSAGASGAIFGVYGAVVGYLLREKQSMPAAVFQPMLKSTVSFAAYNILYGMKAGVDNSDHIGGVLAGVVFGWLLALPVDQEIRRQRTGRKLQIGLVALVVLIAAGVQLTPRFDYSMHDEVAWEEANKEFIAREPDLLKQHQKAIEEIENGADGTAHAGWIESELVPFYTGWDAKLTALQLKPTRLTARRRDALDKIFRMRLQAYQGLIAGLRAHDNEALGRYSQAEEKVNGEIGKLRNP
jgi:rhomboid protease GluP